MKTKIDWYREVLELEPGSKVFFPLARLLAENGQLQDALSALRLGLERHPEFMEARLYFIELSYKNGQIAYCEQQVDQLSRLFAKYPGVWEAWGACAASAEKRRDLSLALRFMALLFQRPDVDMGEVLEKGLAFIAGAPAPPPHVPAPEMKAGKESPPAVSVSDSLDMPVESREPAAAANATAVAEPPPTAKHTEEVDDAEEPFTLRTKSMADILAGQGDIDGALEIYNELAMRAESPEERQEIAERIDQLSSPQAGEASSPLAQDASPPGKHRMQHLLESLAERLESRALG